MTKRHPTRLTWEEENSYDFSRLDPKILERFEKAHKKWQKDNPNHTEQATK